jgi:hypothetical protein
MPGPSPFDDFDSKTITDDNPHYFGPKDPPTAFNRVVPITVEIDLSTPVEIDGELLDKAPTPLDLRATEALPEDPGVYLLECLYWARSGGETWAEKVWSYVGEGQNVSGRLGDYEAASRSVRDKRPVVSAMSHEQRIAHSLMQSLSYDGCETSVLAQRLFLSWVLEARAVRNGEVHVFDLASKQQRRFVERSLIVQSPFASNIA